MSLSDARDRLVERLRERLDVDEAVLAAIGSVPRHEFVPDATVERAYADRPLPIGSNQTISAPHMVALMADLLDVSTGDRVLEIGTGCGYHAAVIAELVGESGHVYSVEYVDALAVAARERLDRLGYAAVDVRVSDGRDGWPEYAPYDAASLTCAAAEGIPNAIIEQTRLGGRIVGPVGRRGDQELIRVTVQSDDLDRERHGGVRFVPMVG
ncbi:protein-L-isoaspartate(D-aspartate) O-methyltransferase [Halopenitus malekzadehii]|uniref:Protein-L-isoaspartate O-methyltransferase n=1 Tax=Halopenitus malekzadehii TaxID=1267564 RepID=A0A1H6HRC0_9EURY|nr:protein-L-isoaspartate(D-aspartate) O-methyltransferase [Halopenitus malekzadehii]SEH36728.1 protein-L-isoaspartate(D-aspartate) O-methyltransferase [Halopenitus malekzadehii]